MTHDANAHCADNSCRHAKRLFDYLGALSRFGEDIGGRDSEVGEAGVGPIDGFVTPERGVGEDLVGGGVVRGNIRAGNQEDEDVRNGV